MTSNWKLRFGWLCLALAASVAHADSIDTQLAKAHADLGIAPTPVCGDTTFFRRLSLDLIGRVPTADEIRAFVADPNRDAAIDRLLKSPEHPRFWSHLWTTMLVGRGGEQIQGVQPEILRRWLEKQLAKDVSIAQMSFELITATGTSAIDGPASYVVANRDDPVMSLSRTFLSVRLDCAQCHDHPHDRWTNEDYLAMQRFYEPLRIREVSGGAMVADGAVDREELPVFLTGRKPHTAAWRRELGMMVVKSKPFSRAMVNRTWHWLMGRGIVDPVDGLSQENPPIVPELLEDLAAGFRSGDYKLRPLIARVCRSHAYQRSVAEDATIDAATNLRMQRLFAARSVRPQLPEQWVASIAVATDMSIPDPEQLAQRSVQLLGLTREATGGDDPHRWQSTTQTLIRQLSLDMPVPLSDLDTVFLSTVGREPTEQERMLLRNFSTKDTIFALVHSNEFVMND